MVDESLGFVKGLKYIIPKRNDAANYCRDCRYIKLTGTDYASAVCLHPGVRTDKVDLVSGETVLQAPFLCSYVRAVSSLCGRHGRYFIQSTERTTK